jgi:hypothetical protein
MKLNLPRLSDSVIPQGQCSAETPIRERSFSDSGFLPKAATLRGDV